MTFRDATGLDAGRAVLVEGAGFARTLVFNAQTALPERLDGVRYLDYRDVAGRKVPSRIVEGPDEWIIEEFTILQLSYTPRSDSGYWPQRGRIR